MFRSRLPVIWAEKETRERRRITQDEVAEATGIRRPTLSVWLSHRPMVTIHASIVAALCKYFECSLEELIEVDEEGQRVAVA